MRDWLLALPDADRRTIGLDLMRVQFRLPIGMPLCRPHGQGLWEARTTLPSARIARVIICFSDGELVALHGFVKKTQKAPPQDIETALKRKKEYLS